MVNLLALWFLGCGLAMFKACAAGVAVRQPQKCYRAGTSLLHYKASSVSSFPRRTGRVKHKSLASTYRPIIPIHRSLFTESPRKVFLLGGNPCMQRQYRVGCSRRVSYFLCRACFEVLPFVGRPFWGGVGHRRPSRSWGATSAGTRASPSTARKLPCGTKGWGRSPCTFSKGATSRVVAKVMAPLMSDTLGGDRFDVVVPVPLHRM
jgi:hypothetical protein